MIRTPQKCPWMSLLAARESLQEMRTRTRVRVTKIRARERCTALIMAVLKWKRANENKQRKVDWFHLFRFELHGDSHGYVGCVGRVESAFVFTGS